ncbi:hypothetical protein BDA96_03G071500 [Sorghum bicolor]|uniref:Uncharacterized protein n=1 Tax=Sorghum bicolor TaxID=4558 RepID=A0A921RBX8_SORBI|nr:hypothetical protein BDA96_03G071500 [Sorghum bicolor]
MDHQDRGSLCLLCPGQSLFISLNFLWYTTCLPADHVGNGQAEITSTVAKRRERGGRLSAVQAASRSHAAMFTELLVVVTHSMATGDDPGTEAGWSGGLEATRQAYMLGGTNQGLGLFSLSLASLLHMGCCTYGWRLAALGLSASRNRSLVDFLGKPS